MAVVGKFVADFSQFDPAVQASGAKLLTFKAAADQTSAAVTTMGVRATTTAGPVNNLRTSMGAFDSVLKAVGISAGPSVSALGELSDVAGMTVKELGAVGTAGLAVGTFMATFKLTGAILEWTGLDKAIGNAVIAMHDFGLNAATAGAKQDVIDRAIKGGADAMISYTDAVKFNNAAWEKATAAAVLPAYRAQLAAIGTAVAALTDDQKALIAEGLALNQSTSEIATGMGIAATTVEQYRAVLKGLATDADNAAAAQKKFADAAAEVNYAGEVWQQTLDTIDGAVVEAIKGYLEAGKSQAALATFYGLTAKQIQAVASALAAEKAARKDVQAVIATPPADAAAAPGGPVTTTTTTTTGGPGLKTGGGPTAPLSESFTTDLGGLTVTPTSGGRSGGGITVVINANGVTLNTLVAQIEAALVKSASLQRLLGGN